MNMNLPVDRSPLLQGDFLFFVILPALWNQHEILQSSLSWSYHYPRANVIYRFIDLELQGGGPILSLPEDYQKMLYITPTCISERNPGIRVVPEALTPERSLIHSC